VEVKKITIIFVVLFLSLGVVWFFIDNRKEGDFIEKEKISEEKREEEVERVRQVLEKGEEINSLKYSVIMENPFSTVRADFWQKGDNMRMEVDMQGRKFVNLINAQKEVAYNYIVGSNIATEIDGERLTDVKRSSVKKQRENLLKEDFELVGKEQLGEKNCYVLSYYGQEEEEIIVWLWEDYGIPVKIEFHTDEGFFVATAQDIIIEDISDMMFEIPQSMEVSEHLIF
jgi:hypothetical protein